MVMKTQTGLTAKAERKTEIVQLVSFFVDDEEYAIPIDNIQGINRMGEITKLPDPLPYVEGITNLRGSIIPLINLRKRLGLPPKDFDKTTRFIVIEFGKHLFGFIVDFVNRVLRLPKDTIEPPPPSSLKIDAKFVTGIAKYENKLIILLDLTKMFTEDEFNIISNF
ncbi:chemotaxis protein CheW [Bacteroidetes/Chlorobi group bacterium Naka2016]|jgi:purine-binding chemotaxis protein CheW|nr:MAG: chemotaxis protein CheW [Bacteroidetes/Chlorobi group bacterium Naka2016]